MSAASRLGSETSAAWILDDRIVQACVEAEVLGAAEHPVQLGRYRVQRGLGAGGMGRLLLATDPDLQRQVAIKLIAAPLAASPQARQRIVAEARAMARLSDPNVAQVYEVGEAEGQLYVAMEFIDGQNLSAWLDAQNRSWSEVLTVFLQAGAGLVAAHDKGITHRDFKPDNVMIDTEGRARVVDFGLSLTTHEAAGSPAEDAMARLPARAQRLTRTGAAVGTPAYMAPEQWAGDGADARSDQFSFCASLFEALSGTHPFERPTVAQTRRALTEPLTRTWPREVPRWIYRALGRGLSPEPAMRWPELRALLRALDPSRRRRRAASVGTAALVLAAGGVGVAASAEDRCAQAGAPIDAVWSEAQRAAVGDALAAADSRWAPDTVAPLLARLDAHAAGWRAAARGICAAAQDSPSEQEGPTPPRQCLDHVRARLAAHIQHLQQGGRAALVGAVAGTELLADPRSCLEASVAWPAAPSEALHSLAEAERSLGAMWVAAGPDAADYVGAVARGHAAASAALAAAPDDAQIQAAAHGLNGRLHLADGEPKEAEAALRRGLAAAQRAGHAPLVAALTVELIYAVARDRERFGEAEDLTEDAIGMVAALGAPAMLSARLAAHRGSALAHARDGDRALAVALQTEALDTIVATVGRHHPMAVAARGNLGVTLNYAGQPERAEGRLTEAIAAANEAWGPDHPRTAGLLGSLGMTRLRQGDLSAAETDLRRALEIREATLPPGHALIDDARYNLAIVLRRQQRHGDALSLLRPGRDSAVARLGSDDARLGPWWVASGEAALALGQTDDAREALREALRIFERTGASAGDYARVRLALARAWRAEDPSRARALATLARADASEAEADKRRAEAEAFLAALDPIASP